MDIQDLAKFFSDFPERSDVLESETRVEVPAGVAAFSELGDQHMNPRRRASSMIAAFSARPIPAPRRPDFTYVDVSAVSR